MRVTLTFDLEISDELELGPITPDIPYAAAHAVADKIVKRKIAGADGCVSTVNVKLKIRRG